ncbi:hypothetical protein OIU74_007806 [Salix koriyanagi]|uniref:Uncharacterized protein n=1 Tax=Salix koriyanagi TaxID=2511006 RepID=A0A9Q0Z6P1_9ROSI|nr:hypothetical protein OIU74_007806 [Salix koriyanagi]
MESCVLISDLLSTAIARDYAYSHTRLLYVLYHYYGKLCEPLPVGISSRYSGSLALKGSPESAVGSSEALIGVQFYKNNVAYESDESGSRSSDLAGRQVSGSGSRKK